ncbi:g10278 [Coccomyxa viridis]|uniref:G10278 protein n=1 Tax=Coccomyxa viridis TaxID=1274662 RepID=A0ABP1G7I5_9CHLO
MTNAWWETKAPVPKRRLGLTHTQPEMPTSGDVWKILKHVVGGSSLDIPLPVQMSLPIDELHRRAEELEFSELLDQAAQKPKGSIERLLLVAAFAQSAFQSVGKLKAMTPIMGETYELVLPEKRMRLLVETTYLNIKENRVINSWVAEGEQWRLEGEDEPVVKFWGTSVELRLNWLDCLTFSDGDTYTWTKMTTGSALISTVGSLTTTYRGTIVVHNEACKQSATVQFKDSSSWKSLGSKKGVKNGIEGFVEKDGQRLDKPTFSGAWTDKVVADMPDGSQWTLFEVKPIPDGPNKMGLNLYSMQLNEMTPGLEAKLPPNDSRWRQDLRAIETGDYAQAAKVAERLNKHLKEREKQYIRQTGATSLPPAWFTLREPNGLSETRGSLPRFRYKGGYWEARDAADWSCIPQDVQQIFST